MKTHWLYGMGPNKELTFEREIDQETRCSECAHWKVCARKMPDRCVNYQFGTSDVLSMDSCDSCIHRFTRFDKEPVPCFVCDDFLPLVP